MHRLVFTRPHKVFHLHLLKLARAENEIPGRHFVAKRLPNLRYTEREFAPAGGQHVEEINENALGRFRTQIDQGRQIVLGRGAHVCLKHQVKRPWVGQIFRTAIWTFSIVEFVGAKSRRCIHDNRPVDR